MKKTNLKSARMLFLMVQESIKHFPIPLRNWLKAGRRSMARGQFLVIFIIGFAFLSLAQAGELTQQAKITPPTQESKESTRIIVTTSGPAKFSSHWLDNPPRLIVEFQTKNILSKLDNEVIVNQGVIKRITSRYFGEGQRKSLKSLTFELAQKVPYRIWQEVDTIILDIETSAEASVFPEDGKEIFVKDAKNKETMIKKLEVMDTALTRVSTSRLPSGAAPKAIAEFPKTRRKTMSVALWFIGLTLISGLGGLLFWLFWRRYRLILDKNKAALEIRKVSEQLQEQNKLLEHEQIIRKTIEDTSLKREKEFEQLKLELQKEKQLLEQEEKVRKTVEEELLQKVKECDETKISLGSLKEMLVEKGLAKKLTTTMEEGEIWIPGKSPERREYPRLDLSKDYNRTIILRIDSEDKSKSIKSFANNIGLEGLCFETKHDFKEKETINLRLFFFGDKIPMMKIKAEIIWKKTDLLVNHYGASFVSIGEKDRAELSRYIESKITRG